MTFPHWLARVLGFTDGGLTLGTKPTSGQYLKYDGTNIVGGTPGGGGGTPTPTAAGDMIGTTDGATWVKRTLAQARGDILAAGATSASGPPTVNSDSSAGFAVGDIKTDTATKIPYVCADATIGAAVWRPVLSDIRLRAYVSGGVVYSVLEGLARPSTWVTIKGPVVLSKTAGTAALGTSASGTGFSLPAGYATLSDKPSTGDCWLEALDGTGGLGVTWTPGSDSQAMIVSDHDQPAGNSFAVCGYAGRVPGTAPGFRGGWKRNNAGTAMVTGEANDLSEQNANATRSGPVTAMWYWSGSNARLITVVGRQTSSITPISTLSAPTQAMTGTMYFGFVLTRVVTGGGAITVSNASVIFTPAAGSLSWT